MELPWMELCEEEKLESCVLRFQAWGHRLEDVLPDLVSLENRFRQLGRKDLMASAAWVLFHVHVRLGDPVGASTWAVRAYEAAPPSGRVAISYRLINGQQEWPKALQFDVKELRSNLESFAAEAARHGLDADAELFRQTIKRIPERR